MSCLGDIVWECNEYPRIEFRNGRKDTAGRGDAKMSASMMRRLTEMTRISATCGRWRSVTYAQRREICLDRFRNRFSLESATALSQSSYIMVGCVWMKPSSVQSLRR